MTEIINSIGYSGEVTVRLSNSSECAGKLHNAGFKALWDLLAMSVAGYNVAEKAPKYFTIASRTGNGTDDNPYRYQDCLLSQLPFLGTVWGDVVEQSESSTSARFTVTVTKNNRRLSIRDNETAVLQMFNRRGELLAEVEDNSKRDIARSHNSMITGVDAIYEWKMTFRNISS
mgnify:CR=1 FL=1